jgi:hypothetical protein
VEEIGFLDLTTEQIETLCSIAEDAAIKYVLSKAPLKMLEKLNISVEANGTKPVNVTVEVDLALLEKMKDFDVDLLVNEAANEAHKASKNFLRKIQ